MEVRATPGTLKAWICMKVFGLLMYFWPDSFELLAECDLCGARITERAIAGHFRYFHPETLCEP